MLFSERMHIGPLLSARRRHVISMVRYFWRQTTTMVTEAALFFVRVQVLRGLRSVAIPLFGAENLHVHMLVCLFV